MKNEINNRDISKFNNYFNDIGIFLLTICMSNLYLLFLLFLPITFCINGNIKNEINS